MPTSSTQFGTIATASAGHTTLAPAVTGSVVKVLGYGFSANGSLNVQFAGSVTGTITPVTGTIRCAANGYYQSHNPEGVFKTPAGYALTGSLSAATDVGGHVTYVYES